MENLKRNPPQPGKVAQKPSKMYKSAGIKIYATASQKKLEHRKKKETRFSFVRTRPCTKITLDPTEQRTYITKVYIPDGEVKNAATQQTSHQGFQAQNISPPREPIWAEKNSVIRNACSNPSRETTRQATAGCNRKPKPLLYLHIRK